VPQTDRAPTTTAALARILQRPPARREAYVVEHESGQQESLTDTLTAPPRQPSAESGILQQLKDPAGTLLHRGDEKATDALLDLQRYTADASGDDRGFFPERFGNDEAESLA
jgi:hypothetical protein